MSRFSAVAAIGDVHARPAAVKALVRKIEQHLGATKFASTALVFLGDYVDRGPDAAATLELLIDLKATRAADSTFFIAGNHDLAASLFVNEFPHSHGCTMNGFIPYRHFEREGLWPHPDKHSDTLLPEIVERMHLQARRWGGIFQSSSRSPCAHSVFQSQPTFASYGAEFGCRAELTAAMPAHHKEFLRDLPWYHEMPHPNGRQTLFFVHAGLLSDMPFAEQLRHLQQQDLSEPWIEWLCGRTGSGTVSCTPADFPNDYMLVNGHHGFIEVDLAARRIICDDGGGHDGAGLAACVFDGEDDGVELICVTPEEWEMEADA